jgi:hypothetical protein
VAKRMKWTDRYGATHAKSVWLATAVAFDAYAKTGQVTFRGWHDAESYAAGRPPLPDAVKQYTVTGDEFDALVGSPVPAGQKTLIGVISRASYDLLADKVKDTPHPTDPDAGEVGFFEAHAAQDVES